MTRDALHTSILSTLALAEAEACPAFPHNDIAAYVHVGSALHEADAFPSAYTYLLKNNLIRAKQDGGFMKGESKFKAVVDGVEGNSVVLLLGE